MNDRCFPQLQIIIINTNIALALSKDKCNWIVGGQ